MFTRCIGFDGDGRERRPGCFNPLSCKFIHPDHPNWSTARPPSKRAERHYFDKRRSPSPPHRLRRSPSPHRHRRSPSPIRHRRSPSPIRHRLSPSPPPPSQMLKSPIPPPPNPPSFSTSKNLPQHNSTSIWESRVKALADSASCRQQLLNVEADIATARSFSQSLTFSSLADDIKSRTLQDLAQLERQREELKASRDQIIHNLIKDDNSWPPIPLSDSQDKELAKHNQLLKDVEHLKVQIDSINLLLRKLDGEPDDHDPMDVDNNPQEGPSSRPLKRRRRGIDSALSPPVEPGPTMKDLESIKSKLEDLQNTYIVFTNDLNARDSEFSQEVIYQIEEKLDELKEASDSTNSAEDLYNGVKNEIVDVGNDVAVLARELAKLMVKAEGQKKEMAQVKERITESRTNFQQLQSTFQCLKESRERDQKTIAALEAAVQMYTENPVATTAPAVPSLSLDQIVDLMEDPLVDIVRETARPLLEDLREQVQTMLNTQNEEMYKTLWGKLSLVLKMVETISKRMERIDQGGPSSSSNVP